MYESITTGNNSFLTRFPASYFTNFDTANDILTNGLLLANWLYPIYHLQALPNPLALGYTWNGNILLSGRKFLILALPVLGSFCLYKTVRKIGRVETINYPFRVTERNYTAVYQWARSCYRYVGLLTQMAIFGHMLTIVNGKDTDRITRLKWVRNGIVGFILGAVVGVGGLLYILKRYIMDEKEITKNETES